MVTNFFSKNDSGLNEIVKQTALATRTRIRNVSLNKSRCTLNRENYVPLSFNTRKNFTTSKSNLPEISLIDFLNLGEAHVLDYLETLSAQIGFAGYKQADPSCFNNTTYTRRIFVPEGLNNSQELVFCYEIYLLIQLYGLQKLQDVSFQGTDRDGKRLNFDFLLGEFALIPVIKAIVSSRPISIDLTLWKGMKVDKRRTSFHIQAVSQLLEESSETEILEHFKFISIKIGLVDCSSEYRDLGPGMPQLCVERNFFTQALHPLQRLAVCYQLHLLVERYLLEELDLVDIEVLLHDGKTLLGFNTYPKNFEISKLANFVKAYGGIRYFNITFKRPNKNSICKVHANNSVTEAWLTKHVNDVLSQSLK